MAGRILVVDDVATNRVVLKAKLAAAYYEIVLAENGTEALEKATSEQPDIILLDVMMPDIDGYAVCRRLKAAPETAHIPIIMVTALSEADEKLRGLECGADDFLSKPINDLALFSRVQNLIRVKFMFDELRLRDSTTQDLGLEDFLEAENDSTENIGFVALLPPRTRTGQHWKSMLMEHLPYDFTLATPDCNWTQTAVPDVFVVHAKLDNYGDGLRLVSHLRTAPNTRHSTIIVVVPEGDQETAAKGLDLGASDYIFDPFDPHELVVRLKGQMRRKRVSDRLRNTVRDTMRLAVLDPLTEIYNRRYATQHLLKITARAKETGKNFALMALDIDKFKHVNDQNGHGVGDLVLKEFARRIQENLRGVDLVSRIGGEEFLVAMPDTTEAEAKVAAERLRGIIANDRFAFAEIEGGLAITVSIGVVVGNSECTDIDALLKQADKALYVSKAEGRNLVTFFKSAA